jgi:hypothetical protein
MSCGPYGPHAAPIAKPSAIHSAICRVVTGREIMDTPSGSTRFRSWSRWARRPGLNFEPLRIVSQRKQAVEVFRQPRATLAAVDRLVDVETALRSRGLEPRGAFHPDAEDQPPVLAHGRLPGTLLLAGSVGSSLWASFEREARREPDPLDRWSARVLAEIAARFGAAVVLPNDGPPRPPFLRWAQRAESVHPSPLGLLIHPDHGLWHAYRGALAFAERLALPPRDTRPSPCAACADRPCLVACPVGAFTNPGFDAAKCASHLESGDGEACFQVGCLARAACPVGRAGRPSPEQARFHLSAFLRVRARQ